VNLDLDTTFTPNYEAAVLHGTVVTFPRNETIGREPIGFTVKPFNGPEWPGVVASAAGKCELYACPNPDELCVLADDRAFIVSVLRAHSYAPIEYANIKTVTPAKDARVLVLATETEIICHGESAWQSHRLCFDGLQVNGIVGSKVSAEAWDPIQGEAVEFELDLNTREQSGYLYPT
jgi:hypothetical protein